jgi:hypothetical protein
MEWNKTCETGDGVSDRQAAPRVNEIARSSPRLAASLDNTKFHQAGFALLERDYIVLGNLMQRSTHLHLHVLKMLPAPQPLRELDNCDTGRLIPVSIAFVG